MPLLHQLACVPLCSFHRPLSSNVCLNTSRLMVAKTSDTVPSAQPITIQRRSVHYEPSIWDYDRIQSLTSAYLEETHKTRADNLKGEVIVMLDRVADPVHKLELIDALERLGISYHFEDEINKILINIYNNDDSHSSTHDDKDLYVVALRFRLLRKHGYHVPQGVFNSFIEESSGDFKAYLGNDLKGILSLYEASYLLVEGESIVEKAKDFTTQHLEDYVNNHYERNKEEEEGQDQQSLSNIRHALEFPQHWRPQRVESRWFIDAYDKQSDKNRVLLELAKLDFNMVQAIHQEELKHLSGWWNSIGLAQKYSSFSRDRLMECFLWSTAWLHEPQFRPFRKMATQVFALITTLDDLYDNYSTFEELKLFTNAIERWDVNATEQLPEYMKLCFMAIFNNANNLAQEVMKKQGIDITHHLKKPMVDLCKAFLLEAEWYYSGYTPSVAEYTENSWISVAGPAIFVYSYFTVANPVTEEALKALENYHQVIRHSAVIARLEDDIEDDDPSKGDFPKSVQCYMNETDSSLEDAREHVKDVVRTTWTKLNKAVRGCPFPKDYVRAVLNLARMAHQMYQDGDGHASQNQASKDRITSLLVNPIPEP